VGHKASCGCRPGSFMDELLRYVNIENVVRGTKIKYPHIGIEELVSLNPDVIIDLSMGSESDNDSKPWNGIVAIKAVREARIYKMDTRFFIPVQIYQMPLLSLPNLYTKALNKGNACILHFANG